MFSTSLLLLLAAASCELLSKQHISLSQSQSLTIDCKVSYSVTSYNTAWIRQPAGKALEWINLIYYDGDIRAKDSLKSKFSISRDTGTNTITLRGQNLQTEDTAVYYCARDTVTLTNEHGLQKPRADTQVLLK
uniref:Ig-like domain-containing protein n=1 Tax=Pygocentrus nattereri TaxID=42514 RepID=A0A3B4DTV4_PYGNA